MSTPSKKARAFKLFAQGYLPASQEIKDLGLHPTNRYKYFHAWEALGKPDTLVRSKGGQPAIVSSTTPSGETIGGVDETKAKLGKDQKEKPQPEDEGIDEGIEEGERPAEQPKGKDEVGVISEAAKAEGKDKGKDEGQEKKIPTRVADDGIKCTVFLSLQTLALYKIAASTQAQYDGAGELNLGDFLDTCTEDFFRVRGKKLGLIRTGGK